MNDIKEQIEEARRQVNIRQRIAAKPGATIEDELQLQCARNWLLTLEKRVLERVTAAQRKLLKGQMPIRSAQPVRMTAKERAAAAFEAITKVGA